MIQHGSSDRPQDSGLCNLDGTTLQEIPMTRSATRVLFVVISSHGIYVHISLATVASRVKILEGQH